MWSSTKLDFLFYDFFVIYYDFSVIYYDSVEIKKYKTTVVQNRMCSLFDQFWKVQG
jgi:hypothetical protein